MKVSIIIPIYNVSKYITKCIQSVINQTYFNIECILIDDYSQDNSIALAKDLLKSYKGSIAFKIIFHKNNKGLSSARNSGTMAATGDYLYYLDSDDEITPDCIDRLIALVHKYPNVEMVQGNMQTIPEPNKQSDWRNIKNKNFPEYIDQNDWIRRKFYTSNLMEAIPMNATNKLIKREFITANNLFFKEGIIHEDELWMFDAVEKLNSIAFTTEYTYIAYSRQGSIMRSNNNYKSIESWIIILNKILKDNDNLYFNNFKKKYVWILYSNMNIINLRTNEKNLYYRYKRLVKEIINNLTLRERIPLYILLTPQIFHKIFIGNFAFRLFMKICMK